MYGTYVFRPQEVSFCPCCMSRWCSLQPPCAAASKLNPGSDIIKVSAVKVCLCCTINVKKWDFIGSSGAERHQQSSTVHAE